MMFYFGVQSPAHKGHYIYRPNFYTVRFDGHEFNQTLTRMLDGGFLNLHRVPDHPGQGVWFPVADMLILTWWDRSGDSRGASNSAIIRPYSDTDERAVGWTQFVEEAQAAFPTIFARQTARIVDNRNPAHRFIDPPTPAPAVAE